MLQRAKIQCGALGQLHDDVLASDLWDLSSGVNAQLL